MHLFVSALLLFTAFSAHAEFLFEKGECHWSSIDSHIAPRETKWSEESLTQNQYYATRETNVDANGIKTIITEGNYTESQTGEYVTFKSTRTIRTTVLTEKQYAEDSEVEMKNQSFKDGAVARTSNVRKYKIYTIFEIQADGSRKLIKNYYDGEEIEIRKDDVNFQIFGPNGTTVEVIYEPRTRIFIKNGYTFSTKLAKTVCVWKKS